MKALVHTQPYKFEIREVPVPDFGDEELLVRVKAVGICGSDIHGATGKTGRRKPPIIMGHEASGVVEKTGKNVTGFKIGDRVTFDSTVYCGKCIFCKAGRINLCDNRMVLGVSCDGYRRDGAMAEYVVVPERIAYHLPDQLFFPEASLVEALSIALHAVNRTPLAFGNTCGVVGTGLIGLLAVQVLKLSGCGLLIAFDVNKERLELAKRSGADITVDLSEKENPASKYFNAIDAVVEAVGIEETVIISTKLVRKGGVITLVGNLSPVIQFPLQEIVTKEISFNGSCASSGEYPVCIKSIASGRINVKPLISRIVPLEEGIKYFDILINKKESLLKVILVP